MNKKVIVFLLVLVGLGGFVWWQTSAPQSAQDRLAKAMNIMQGLESRAIPVALTGDQIKLLEQVYQDSLERIPNIQWFRDTDRNKLISTLQSAGLTGTGPNGLNQAAEGILLIAADKTDVFASKISAYMTNLGTTVSGTVATNIKKLAQSVNTLTNDIRLTKLYVAWYEGIRAKICTTNDPNNDIYISGEVKMVYTPNTSLQDSCRSDGVEVKQYKCINGLYEDTAEHVSKTPCPNGCSGGVCLREETQELTFDMPATGVVGRPVTIDVHLKNNYNQTFFIIVEGDDDAEYPTGALKIMSGEVGMSGEASRKFEIKFSKPGNMTVIVRPRTGPEASGIIGVTTGDTGGGGGYTVSCSSITGASVAGCNDCKRINLASNSLAQSVFTPRNGPTGSKEFIVSGQSTITGLAYQNAQVTPTGNIKNLFNISESSPNGSTWEWARMSPGNLVIKWNTQPTSIISNNPIYSIRYTIPSVLKNAAGTTISGSSATATQCHFYYNVPPVTASTCIDSDGGKDYYKAGHVELSDKTFWNNGRKEDTCSEDGKTVTEYNCMNSSTYDGSTSFVCPNGCRSGACIASQKIARIDVIAPSEVITNEAFDMTVRILDTDGKKITNYEGTIYFEVDQSATNPDVVLPVWNQGYKFKLADQWEHTFPRGFIIRKAGSYRIGTFEIETSGNGITTQTTISARTNSLAAACTGTRPVNSTIVANVGTTSRAWTYDGSPTGPYQNCSFRCQTGYTFSNNSCVQNTTQTCPQLSPPPSDFCKDGQIIDGGKNASGCQLPPTCVVTTQTCPQLSPPPSDFCKDGQIIDGGTNANGCQLPPTCGPKIITGSVQIDGVKDCWFGDVTKKITLGDFIGYQSSTNSGLRYLDEILLYGATAPAVTAPSLTNIFSYEESTWTAAEGNAPTNSAQLSNFFVLRTNSDGVRTWNIPTTGTKFYGCFSRGDRPNTW